MNFYTRPLERSGSTAATHWTVRSPYRTVRDDNDDVVSDQPSDEPGPSNNDPKPPVSKSIRSTRPTPAFLPNFVRTEPENPTHGEPTRLYNNRNPMYSFPCVADELENHRQDHHHTALSIIFRGLYPCPDQVRTTLQNDGTPKYILDLGCGTGTWAIEMAKEFPHTTVLGVDLSPCAVHPADIPSNCRFEIDDINNGLDHFNNTFDLVHLRNVSMGIKNFRKTMEEVSKCLKPGGLAIFIDGDTELLHRDMVTVLPMAMLDHEIRRDCSESEDSFMDSEPRTRADGSWVQRFLYEVTHASQLGGSDLSGAADAVDEGLWRMNMFDSDSCGASSVFLPIGPWLRTPDETSTVHLQHVGSLLRINALSVLRAARSLLLRRGISQSMLDQMVTAATYELKAGKFESFARLRVAWGRRKQASESTNMNLSPVSTTSQIPEVEPSTNYDRIRQNCQPVAMYASQAEALMAKEARIMTRTVQPVPFVVQLANKGRASI